MERIFDVGLSSFSQSSKKLQKLPVFPPYIEEIFVLSRFSVAIICRVLKIALSSHDKYM